MKWADRFRPFGSLVIKNGWTCEMDCSFLPVWAFRPVKTFWQFGDLKWFEHLRWIIWSFSLVWAFRLVKTFWQFGNLEWFGHVR